MGTEWDLRNLVQKFGNSLENVMRPEVACVCVSP